MTARCPLGCEWWAPPEVMARHVYNRRCPGRAWFRNEHHDEVLIEHRDGQRLEELDAGELLEWHRISGERLLDGKQPYLRIGIHNGAVLHSPLPDVPVRVWWKVVRPLLDVSGARALVARAATEDGFATLAPPGVLDRCQPCPECGEIVLGVAQHQKRSTRCRAATAANHVRDLWTAGYRDPWTIPGGAPLTWTELQVARWRKRVEVVEFPRWNAVLLRGDDCREPRAI